MQDFSLWIFSKLGIGIVIGINYTYLLIRQDSNRSTYVEVPHVVRMAAFEISVSLCEKQIWPSFLMNHRRT